MYTGYPCQECPGPNKKISPNDAFTALSDVQNTNMIFSVENL